MFGAYHDFVRRNQALVLQVESSLNGLLLLVPGRYGEALIPMEACQSAIEVLRYYHDLILARTPGRDSLMHSRPSILLNLIAKFEVLAEMLAVHHKADRWSVVLAIEVVKAYLRLLLLHSSKCKTLLDDDTKPTRESNPNEFAQNLTGIQSEISFPPTIEDNTETKENSESLEIANRVEFLRQPEANISAIIGKRTKRPLVFGPRIIPPVVAPLNSPVHRNAQLIRAFGEILYILRPIIYVLAIQKFSRTSWKAWYISLVTELVATFLSVPTSTKKVDMKKELDEISRRKKMLMLYLLRSPLFESFTSKPPRFILNKMKSLPLVGGISVNLLDLMGNFNSYFFYTG